MSRGRALNSSVSCQSPSSSMATRMPPSASSFATTAPPAPAPITQASTSTTPLAGDPTSGHQPALGRMERAGAVAVGALAGVACGAHQRASAARSARPRATTASAS